MVYTRGSQTFCDRYPVAYAEIFHGVVFHSVKYGGHFYFVCTVSDITIGSHIHVSKPMFWRILLTQYAYSSTGNLVISCVIALNINYQRSKLG